MTRGEVFSYPNRSVTNLRISDSVRSRDPFGDAREATMQASIETLRRVMDSEETTGEKVGFMERMMRPVSIPGFDEFYRLNSSITASMRSVDL